MDSDSKEPGSQSNQNENELGKPSSSSTQISQKAKSAFRNIKGSFGRAKEKLMQNIGKADRSRDEVMEEYVELFQGQKKLAHKLQEVTKSYAHCVKSTQGAFQDLCEVLMTMYSQDWVEHDKLESMLHELNNLKQIQTKRLNEEVVEMVNKYVGQYNQVAQKVSRMEKKLTDYDASRHSLEHLQNAKGEDFAKIEKAQNRVKETWREFEPLQTELIIELPAVCDSRIKFFSEEVKTLFETERAFHEETSKHFEQLCAVMEELDAQLKSGRYNIERRQPALTAPPEVSSGEMPPKSITSIKEHPIEIN